MRYGDFQAGDPSLSPAVVEIGSKTAIGICWKRAAMLWSVE